MHSYIFQAKQGPGGVIDVEVAAETKEEAVQKVEAMGLVPIRVTEKIVAQSPSVSCGRLILSGWKRIARKNIGIFTWQFASLLRAGVPVLQALTLLAQQSGDQGWRDVVFTLEREIRSGKMLSDALRNYPQYFDVLYVGLVRAGEKSGTLDQVLQELAEHLQKQQALRQQIQSALAYPLLMLTVGIGTVFIILAFFLPRLTDLFADMGEALPLPTRILLAVSHFMVQNWYWLLAFAAMITLLCARLKQGTKRKLFMDWLKLRIHFVRRLISQAEILRFSRTLSLVLANGIPAFEGFELARATVNNEAFRDCLEKAGKRIVTDGATLSASLAGTGMFPPLALSMIVVGEKSGRLEHALMELANSCEREINQNVRIIMSLLEPLLILLIGGVVGFIVFAVLLPVFNIGTIAK
ncbi:MAG: type II secretion system F family protein [Verrucomicrobiota bacterium]